MTVGFCEISRQIKVLCYSYPCLMNHNYRFDFTIASSIGRHIGWHFPQRLYSRPCETPRHKSDVPRGWLRRLYRGCGNQRHDNGCKLLSRTNTNLRRVWINRDITFEFHAKEINKTKWHIFSWLFLKNSLRYMLNLFLSWSI